MTISEINQEIVELENSRITRQNISDLAILYLVRQNLQNNNATKAPVNYSNDSKFLQTIANKDINAVLTVIDELVSAVEILDIRLYNKVIQKLNKI